MSILGDKGGLILKIKKTNNPEYGYKNKDELYLETQQHRVDVARLMSFIALELNEIGYRHDWSKIEYFDQFAKDTLERQDTPDFKSRDWYKIHTTEERHHLNANTPKDVDLLDVLEFICDCVVAGKSRTGRVEKKYLELSAVILKQAFWNTVNKLTNEVELEED